MTDGWTVFLDRDGVINRKRPEGAYVTSWAEFAFLPRAKEAIRQLREAGLRLIVVTNQRGVARQLMTDADLQEIHQRMLAEIAAAGGGLDAIYACRHDLNQCTCRKPQPGLFLQAKDDFPTIDFARSTIVGDSLSDMEAGAHLGCRTILIADEPRRATLLRDAAARGIVIDAVAPSLFDAVTAIRSVADMVAT